MLTKFVQEPAQKKYVPRVVKDYDPLWCRITNFIRSPVFATRDAPPLPVTKSCLNQVEPENAHSDRYRLK